MLLPLKDMAGKQLGEVEVSDAIFAAPVNTILMHQALIRQLANQRAGTHKVKTRGEVRGGGRKPWRQKGTGRARQGSTRSPNWVGGGAVFGPTPRSYAKAMPRKMRRSALRSCLSAKAAGGGIVILDQVVMQEPKTREMARTLSALGLDGQSVLLVTAEKNEVVQKSASNLPRLKTLLSTYLNIRDLLGHDVVLFSRTAVEHVESWLGGSDAMETDDLVDTNASAEIVTSEPMSEEATSEETVAEE